MSTMYRPEYLPEAPEIVDAFVEEITQLGGVVRDVFSDERHLFTRAVLAADAEVRRGDTIKAGVALAVREHEILVSPYTYRLVCSNGAIAVDAISSQRLARIQSTGVWRPSYDVAVTLDALRTTVRECAAPDVFAATVGEMRAAAAIDAPSVLSLLLTLAHAHVPQDVLVRELPRIFDRFANDGDRSAFGLVNAVTSVARDAQDPRIRWNLEELGGGLLARLSQHREAPRPTATAEV